MECSDPGDGRTPSRKESGFGTLKTPISEVYGRPPSEPSCPTPRDPSVPRRARRGLAIGPQRLARQLRQREHEAVGRTAAV